MPQFWGSALSPELLGACFSSSLPNSSPWECSDPNCAVQTPRPTSRSIFGSSASSPQCLGTFGRAWLQGQWLKTQTFFSFLPLKSKVRFLYFSQNTLESRSWSFGSAKLGPLCHISALLFLLHRPPRSSSEELGDISRDVVLVFACGIAQGRARGRLGARVLVPGAPGTCPGAAMGKRREQT